MKKFSKHDVSDEIDLGPVSNQDLAKSAVKHILLMQAVKWGLIIGITKALKRAAENAK